MTEKEIIKKVVEDIKTTLQDPDMAVIGIGNPPNDPTEASYTLEIIEGVEKLLGIEFLLDTDGDLDLYWLGPDVDLNQVLNAIDTVSTNL